MRDVIKMRHEVYLLYIGQMKNYKNAHVWIDDIWMYGCQEAKKVIRNKKEANEVVKKMNDNQN